MDICKVVTHEMPHFDEYVAYWLLVTFGKDKFPGVETAEIGYVSTGSNPSGSKTSDELLYENGILALGVWFGKFDEHANQSIGKKGSESDCTATLVANCLGIQDDPALKKLLRFTLITDQKATAQPFDLSSVVKDLHARYPTNPNIVFDWVMLAIEAKYQGQFEFVQARKEYEQNSRMVEISQTYNMCVIHSDNPHVSKYARMGGADVIVQFNTDGHVVIFTQHNTVHDFYKVARIIRIKERKANGITETLDEEALVGSGIVSGSEVWYLNEPRNSLFNGSLRNSDVLVTKLSEEIILEAVVTALNPETSRPSFHGQRQGEERLATDKQLQALVNRFNSQ